MKRRASRSSAEHTINCFNICMYVCILLCYFLFARLIKYSNYELCEWHFCAHMQISPHLHTHTKYTRCSCVCVCVCAIASGRYENQATITIKLAKRHSRIICCDLIAFAVLIGSYYATICCNCFCFCSFFLCA